MKLFKKPELLPMLRGFITTKGDKSIITVYCPYCDAWHVHGWNGKESHRAAHCETGKHSEFSNKNGYFVAPFKKNDISKIKKYLI